MDAPIWTDPDNNMRFSYQIKDDYITVTLTAKTEGWVGVGFGGEQAFRNADAVVGWVTNDQRSMLLGPKKKVFICRRKTDLFGVDSWVGIEQIEPFLDVKHGGQNNVVLLSSQQANGETTLTFERHLITSDIRDMDLVDQDMFIFLGKIKFMFKFPFIQIIFKNQKKSLWKR